MDFEQLACHSGSMELGESSLLADLGIELDPWDLDDDAAEPGAEASVATVAKRMGKGRKAASLVYGNGTTRVGIGPMNLDWRGTVERMTSPECDTAERIELTKALGTLAQVQAHGDPMREAGVVDAVTALLKDPDDMVTIAAAEAIRHLACANQSNRIASRDGGAIPLLVAMLQRVADHSGSDDEMSCHDAAVVTASTAALRNLSFQNGENQDLIRFSGGLSPLIAIVAQGQPPAAPPSGTQRREAAYRAAGALENLAADNEENAEMIVAARVVPAMKELLIGGGQGANLSQKAARMGRQALFKLMAMDSAAAKARANQEAAATSAREARQTTAAVRSKVELLQQLRDKSDESDAAPPPATPSALEEATLWSAAESELCGLTQDAAWSRAMLRYARDGGEPPAPLPCPDKARRAAIHRVAQRYPLGVAVRAEAVGGDTAVLVLTVVRDPESS